MKVKDKGFTLVEVIATMTILGIIMLLAIPNITGVIEKNRAKKYVEDAKKLIALAKYKVARESLDCSSGCTWMLETLDPSKEIDKGPHGYLYAADSFVTYDGQDYRVRLYENMAGTYTGISAGSTDNITKETDLYTSSPTSLISKFNAKDGKPVGQDSINDNTYGNYSNSNSQNTSYYG